MAEERCYFVLWNRMTLRGRRYFWHCRRGQLKVGNDLESGNHEIVFNGQSRGYRHRIDAIHGINLARGTSVSTPIHERP